MRQQAQEVPRQAADGSPWRPDLPRAFPCTRKQCISVMRVHFRAGTGCIAFFVLRSQTKENFATTIHT